MRILPNPLAFEWDEGNIRSNVINHRVMTQEAEEVFMGKPKKCAISITYKSLFERPGRQGTPFQPEIMSVEMAVIVLKFEYCNRGDAWVQNVFNTACRVLYGVHSLPIRAVG